MKFIVFRCVQDPDYFIVTDEAHVNDLSGERHCPNGGALEKVGEYPEMGDRRLAFDEHIAINSIREHGWYRFEAKSFDPTAQPPGTMPG